MTINKRTRAAIYARTNQDPRSVSETIRLYEQIKLCLSVAEAHGFSGDEIHVYKDEGLSGVATSALGLDKLLSKITDYQCVYIKDCCRISRDGIQAARAINLINNAETALWSCDPIHKITPPKNEAEQFATLLRKAVLMDERDRRVAASRRKEELHRLKQSCINNSVR